MVEALRDPLTHMIRNAIDHGIETPDHRLERGKAETGCLSLRAFHEGGQIVVEVQDDGAGINLERLREKALTQKIVSENALLQMSDQEVLRLIFHPGLSTAKALSNVSGRGVGMDVVRTSLEAVGASVEVESSEGIGTCIRCRIPLTLAIVPALIINCQDQKFAIPQTNLLEMVGINPEEPKRNFERIGSSTFYRLRGELLPVLDANDVLGMTNGEARGQSEDELAQPTLIVARAAGLTFGIVVEQIHDTEEIVVKPLSELLSDAQIYSGATVLGDGSIALILDTMGIARTHLTSHEHPGLRRGRGKRSA